MFTIIYLISILSHMSFKSHMEPAWMYWLPMHVQVQLEDEQFHPLKEQGVVVLAEAIDSTGRIWPLGQSISDTNGIVTFKLTIPEGWPSYIKLKFIIHDAPDVYLEYGMLHMVHNECSSFDCRIYRPYVHWANTKIFGENRQSVRIPDNNVYSVSV